jgi:hypothetical protein
MWPSNSIGPGVCEVIVAGSGGHACVAPMRTLHKWSRCQKDELPGDRQSGCHREGEVSPSLPCVSGLPMHRIAKSMRQLICRCRAMHGSKRRKANDSRADFEFISEKSDCRRPNLGNRQSDLIPDSPSSLQGKRLKTGSIFHSIGITTGQKGGL